jgi:hypothetical protein
MLINSHAGQNIVLNANFPPSYFVCRTMLSCSVHMYLNLQISVSLELRQYLRLVQYQAMELLSGLRNETYCYWPNMFLGYVYTAYGVLM